MGAEGAAIATVASRVFGSLLVLLLFLGKSKKKAWRLPFSLRLDKQGKMQYAVILLPIVSGGSDHCGQSFRKGRV